MTRPIAALTGATGFVGGAAARRLLADGWRVRALSRRPAASAPVPDGVETVPGDLADLGALRALCADADAVIHIAGLTRARSRAAFDATNVNGVRAIVGVAAQCAPAGRFVLVSSMAAREPHLSDYAASKRAGEEVLHELGADLAWTALRPPAVYGPGDRELASFFRLIASGWAVTPKTAAAQEARLSLIHVDDLARAIARAAAGAGPDRAVLEVSDGAHDGYTWRQIVETGAAALGVRARRIDVPFRLLWGIAALNAATQRLAGGSAMLTPGKARELFHPDWVARQPLLADHSDWRPTIRLTDGFADTIAWCRAQELI